VREAAPLRVVAVDGLRLRHVRAVGHELADGLVGSRVSGLEVNLRILI
jgi:hypothetical protein